MALVEAGTNTIMTRTFSKVFGLGGMRLGWAYAPPHIIDVLNRVRGPFNVNAPAAGRRRRRPGRARLGREVASPTTANGGPGSATGCGRSASRWCRARAISSWPTSAPPSAPQAADAALKARGLIVRAMASYSLPACLRITIGTAEECGMVLDALTGFLRGR